MFSLFLTLVQTPRLPEFDDPSKAPFSHALPLQRAYWSKDGKHVVTEDYGTPYSKAWDLATLKPTGEKGGERYRPDDGFVFNYGHGSCEWSRGIESRCSFNVKVDLGGAMPTVQAPSLDSGDAFVAVRDGRSPFFVIRLRKGQTKKLKAAVYDGYGRPLGLAARRDGTKAYVLWSTGDLKEYDPETVTLRPIADVWAALSRGESAPPPKEFTHVDIEDKYGHGRPLEFRLMDNERTLFVRGRWGDYALIDVATGKLIAHGSGAVGEVSPDGRRLAVAVNALEENVAPIHNEVMEYQAFVRDLTKGDEGAYAVLDDPATHDTARLRLAVAAGKAAVEALRLKSDTARLEAGLKEIGFRYDAFKGGSGMTTTESRDEPGTWSKAGIPLYMKEGTPFACVVRFRSAEDAGDAQIYLGMRHNGVVERSTLLKANVRKSDSGYVWMMLDVTGRAPSDDEMMILVKRSQQAKVDVLIGVKSP